MSTARNDLESLVAVPSVSADPAHAQDVGRAAELVAGHARDAGAERVAVVDAGGAPAVIAHWPAPEGQPTVLLYAHVDVQPTGPREQWSSDPFVATEREGRLYGRGAADDKAGVMMHLAVLRAFGGRPPVGVTLFVEGEEEIGSPTLTALLAAHTADLAADVIVIADSANAAVDVPAFTTSLRGLVDTTVTVRTAIRAVHSGLYGGPTPDALTALCRLLATLHTGDGDVAIEGLRRSAGSTSDVPDPGEQTLRGDVGLLDGVALLGSGTLPERLWHTPAVTVLGMDAPPVAEASNVLLPVASAKVSLRIAPGDTAENATARLTEHLQTHAPWGAEVTLSDGSAGEAYALEASGPVYDLARRVFAQAYGNEAVEAGIGGSIPFIAEFARTFPGATVLVTGVGDPASRWHGIDESLHLLMWERACTAEALLLEGLVTR